LKRAELRSDGLDEFPKSTPSEWVIFAVVARDGALIVGRCEFLERGQVRGF
jgi:hypothetical protein